MSRIPEIIEELRTLLPGDLVRYHYINALLDEIRWWSAWEETQAKMPNLSEYERGLRDGWKWGHCDLDRLTMRGD